MQTLNVLLDNARRIKALKSDAALSEALGVKRQSVSAWRHGTAKPSDENLATLIKLAGATPETLIQVKAELSSTQNERAMWRRTLDRLGAVAAIVLMLAGLAPHPATASQGAKCGTSYTLCEIIVGGLNRLRRLFLGFRRGPVYCAATN